MTSRFFASLSALAVLSVLTFGCAAQTSEEDPSGVMPAPAVEPGGTALKSSGASCNSSSVGAVNFFGTCTSGTGSCFGVKSNGTTCSGADFQCTQSTSAQGTVYRWDKIGPTLTVFMPDQSDQVCVID